ncbi:MAG: FtsX-like permease family protein [Gemmatimonadota bacterium]|nr:FtsX-like permease family protein [Gemmatimonadota bacterium]
MYEPFAQQTRWNVFLAVRSPAAPEALAPAIRAHLAALDPSVPLYDVGTLEGALSGSLVTKRAMNQLIGGFALVALLLATMGIYGVMSLNVNDRVNEFGVRLALGAEPRHLLRLVIRQGMMLALIGVVAGLAGASILTGSLRGLLFGVPPLDPVTCIAMAVLLSLVALAACYVPARRATRAEPSAALRHE